MKHHNFKIKTPDGWSSFHSIQKKSSRQTLLIETDSGSIKTTMDHVFKTSIGFLEAQFLEYGHKIISSTGEAFVLNVEPGEIEDVFDPIEVKSENHLYYSNDFVSHNCEFLGSSGTLISGEALSNLTHVLPIQDSQGLKMYEAPIPGKSYVCMVDVSRGKALDYSAIQIIDVSQMPYKQVCVYRNNMITPTDYAEMIYRIGKAYNDAMLLIEINDIGGQVADTLHYDYEVETILYTETAGRSGKRISGGFGKSVDRGIRTTKTVKSIGCSILKMLIENNQLLINDHETIKELTTFAKKGGSFEASPGCHDDLVMCLVLFAWLTAQDFFKDITDINTMAKLREKTDEEVLEDLTPFGFTYDDVEDFSVPIFQEESKGWLSW